MADGGVHISGPLVVASWGGLNGLLTALLAGMGGSPAVLTIYGSAVVLIELIAAAAALARRWRPGGPARLAPPGGATALLIAIGAALAGLGLAFGWWITILSVPAFIGGAANEAYLWHKRSVSQVTGQAVPGGPPDRPQPQSARRRAGQRAAR